MAAEANAPAANLYGRPDPTDRLFPGILAHAGGLEEIAFCHRPVRHEVLARAPAR